MYEIEFWNLPDVDHLVLRADATCPTDLMNQAYALQRQNGAELVNFGLAIERDEYGMPAYPREEKKKYR